MSSPETPGRITDTRPRRLKVAQNQEGFTLGTDDRIALFPETVRVINTINKVATSGNPALGLTPSGPSIRAQLSKALEWAGRERWLLIEGACNILAVQRGLAS